DVKPARHLALAGVLDPEVDALADAEVADLAPLRGGRIDVDLRPVVHQQRAVVGLQVVVLHRSLRHPAALEVGSSWTSVLTPVAAVWPGAPAPGKWRRCALSPATAAEPRCRP